MLAHGEATRNMDANEYLGNLILLIIGGNDTTRQFDQRRPVGFERKTPISTRSCAATTT